MAISKIQSDSITDSAVTSDKISGGAIGVSDLGTQVQGALGTRNLIINGDMRIDQRNAGASSIPTASGYSSVDRMKTGATTGSKYSIQQMNNSDTAASNYEFGSSPEGFANSIKITSLSAYTATSTDFMGVFHAIEQGNVYHLDWGNSNAKTVTISFWVKSSVIGTFGGAVGDGSAAYSYAFEYTINAANTWEKKEITIEGPTSTWSNRRNHYQGGLYLYLPIQLGSTYQTTPNTWYAGEKYGATGQTQLLETNGATWYLTGVQLEIGDTATPFEHRPYDMELARCQRYYYRVNYGHPDSTIGAGAMYTNILAYVATPFPVTMRAKPSIEVENETGFRVFAGNGVSNPSTVTAWSQGSVTNGMVRVDGLARTQGQACFMDTNQSTSKLSWSAEL